MTTRQQVLVNMAMTADGRIDTVARDGARISRRADSARVDRLRAAPGTATRADGDVILRYHVAGRPGT